MEKDATTKRSSAKSGDILRAGATMSDMKEGKTQCW